MNEKVENAAIVGMVGAGAAATTAGVIAAGSATTGAISAAGAAIGGVAGGVLGSSVGLVTGGFGMAATIPFAAGGAAIGSFAGPALAIIGIGTAPAWAFPAAIAGCFFTTAGVAVGGYKLLKRRSKDSATRNGRPDA